MTTHEVLHGDCLNLLRNLPDDSVDLVFTSPPYESARLYGELQFKLKGQGWVDWAFERYVECVRVSRGLVAWVVEGQTRQFRWSATPALLMADLHRAGVKLRKPPAFHRVGIAGSGGPDWLRNDYEFLICSSKGRLPWSDATATGKPPKYKPGGRPSHRKRNGKRDQAEYSPPAIANPGNVMKFSVGGGRMGSMLAHENEAPFPEGLADAFIRSFCPLGGIVLDCFAGSGTTLAAAVKTGRNSMGMELREEQCELARRRVEEAQMTVNSGANKKQISARNAPRLLRQD